MASLSKPSSVAHAAHMRDGDDHVVALGNIDVFINEAPDGWFAETFQLDYFACGESEEDVKQRFTKGLVATLEEYLRRFNSIEKFLRWAPEEARARMREKLDSDQYCYTVVGTYHIEQPQVPINLTFLKEERRPARP